MRKLKLAREQLCTRLCTSILMLDRWLLPEDDPNAMSMPECGKAYLREVLDRHPQPLQDFCEQVDPTLAIVTHDNEFRRATGDGRRATGDGTILR
jgi:ketosteroid isomerase-like protein